MRRELLWRPRGGIDQSRVKADKENRYRWIRRLWLWRIKETHDYFLQITWFPFYRMKEVLVTQTMSNLHPKERSESEVASGGRGERRTRKVFSYGRGGLSFPLPTTGERNLDSGRYSLLGWGLQLRGGADWEGGEEEEEEEMTDHEGARKNKGPFQ